MASYPMDITVICSIGLEGGLARYRDVLPYFSQDNFDFIHEWNRSLKATMNQPEFKQYMNYAYRIMLALPSKTLSYIIDKTAVPYRSYHYAKRFLDAYNFVSQKAKKEDKINVVDFGRGLSPWGHIVRKDNPNIDMFSFDKEETNNVFMSVSKKMGLSLPGFNKMPEPVVFDRDVFVSLGTFVYLSKEEQKRKLEQVSKQFKSFFIELDKPNADQPDKSVVNGLGAQYNSGVSLSEMEKIIGTNIPFSLTEFCAGNKNVKLARILKNVTEMNLVR